MIIFFVCKLCNIEMSLKKLLVKKTQVRDQRGYYEKYSTGDWTSGAHMIHLVACENKTATCIHHESNRQDFC